MYTTVIDGDETQVLNRPWTKKGTTLKTFNI